MKLSILGGGGFRTPFVYEALLRDTGSPRITEVTLYDTSEQRLEVIAAILDRMGADHDGAPVVSTSTELEPAIAGSDFVFAAIRVGGVEGRQVDEHVALDLGVLGQETTGPGGLAYAMRTVPTMVHIAEVIRREAPTAFVMNFTNPAGIVTEAMQSVLGDRVVGICDTPSGLGRRIARLLGVTSSRLELDYVGLNHLGWMRRVLYNGEDLLPALLADEKLTAQLEEGEIFGTDWLRSLGAIPNEYLYYYYFNRDAVASIRAAGPTRGDQIAESQHDFYEGALDAGDDIVNFWWRAVAGRSAGYMAEAKDAHTDAAVGAKLDEPTEEENEDEHGYAGVALAVMKAITRNERSTMILNVRNGTTVPGLPADAVIEVSATVDANGVHPHTIEQPRLEQLGLMQQVKAVERFVISASLTGSREDALRAFANHPLVDSVEVARKLLAGYLDGNPDLARILSGEPARAIASNRSCARSPSCRATGSESAPSPGS